MENDEYSSGLVCDGRGWYKAYRQLDQWEWYKNSHMVHLFIHCLNKANFEDKQWEGVPVKRGQFITSVKHLSADTGISVQSIRTCLEKLKSTNEITIKTTNKYTVITVTKYNTYQSGEEETNKQINKPTNKQLTNNQQTTNNNEEVKKERNIYMPNFSPTKDNKKRKELFLPSDIEPSVWDAFVEMRKTMKKPLTEHAKKLIVDKLITIKQDKNKILNQSIQNSWIGVFPVKDAPNKKNEGDWV